MTKLNDLTGKKFGLWIVIEKTNSKYGKTHWLCECQCKDKTRRAVNGQNLLLGKTKSCGCNNPSTKMDLSGRVYGRLTVIKRVKWHTRRTHYLCTCSCDGKEININAESLQDGRTTSCGCVHKEMLQERNFIHGYTGTRLFNIWAGMKERCSNPNIDAYQYYGARNISVCDEWQWFENFLDWAYDNSYSEEEKDTKYKLSIERIDVNKNYEPSNCMWIPKNEQSKNTRRTNKITYNGCTKLASEWAEKYEVSSSTIYRYFKANKIEEKFAALDEKIKKTEKG